MARPLDKASVQEHGAVYFSFPDAYSRGSEFFEGRFMEPPAERLDKYLALIDDSKLNLPEIRRVAQQWIETTGGLQDTQPTMRREGPALDEPATLSTWPSFFRRWRRRP